MGRMVIHHSPDKHPEQDDPGTAMDKVLQQYDQTGGPGTYRGQRQDTAQGSERVVRPQDTLEYLKGLAGGLMGGKKK